MNSCQPAGFVSRRSGDTSPSKCRAGRIAGQSRDATCSPNPGERQRRHQEVIGARRGRSAYLQQMKPQQDRPGWSKMRPAGEIREHPRHMNGKYQPTLGKSEHNGSSTTPQFEVFWTPLFNTRGSPIGASHFEQDGAEPQIDEHQRREREAGYHAHLRHRPTCDARQ